MNLCKNYRLYIDGRPHPVEKARVSRFPLNRNWPGHQRPLEQTEVTGFASFPADGGADVRIECDFAFEEVVVRPLSLGIKPDVQGSAVSFRVERPCQATVEFDGISGALHLFADPARQYVLPKENLLYFGRGEHDVGRITLKSGQTVFLDEGAVVYGEIYAEDVENVAILGKGILDHSKAEAAVEDTDFIDPPRPSPIEIRYSKSVLIRDIVVRDPCFLAVRPICCEDVHIDNIKIIGCWRYNSDGIDLINSRNCLIENCFVRSFDDSLCLKGFCYPFADQMRHNGKVYDLMENVTFRNCVVFNDWGKALEVGVDICAAEIRSCRFENCDVIHATHSIMDVSNVDYADVHDIVFENNRAEYGEVSYPMVYQYTDEQEYPGASADYMPLLIMNAVYYSEVYSSPGERRGKIRDITFRDISVTAPRMPPSLFSGFNPEYGVENVTVSGLRLNGQPVSGMEQANFEVRDFVKNLRVEQE